MTARFAAPTRNPCPRPRRLNAYERGELDRLDVQAPREQRKDPSDREPPLAKQICGAAQRMTYLDWSCEYRAVGLEQRAQVGAQRTHQRKAQSQDHRGDSRFSRRPSVLDRAPGGEGTPEPQNPRTLDPPAPLEGGASLSPRAPPRSPRCCSPTESGGRARRRRELSCLASAARRARTVERSERYSAIPGSVGSRMRSHGKPAPRPQRCSLTFSAGRPEARS